MTDFSTKSFSTVLALTMGLMMGGCKKDDPITKTSLLTSGPWRWKAMTATPGFDDGTGKIVTDQYANFKACEKDNLIRYETPNKFAFDEGATKCQPNDPQLYWGTWAFNEDETGLLITQSGYTTKATLKELTQHVLIYSYPIGTSNGTSIITETHIRD